MYRFLISILAISALASPLFAQKKVIRKDIGLSFTIPASYTPGQPQRPSRETVLYLSGPRSDPKTTLATDRVIVNTYLVSTIRLYRFPLELPEEIRGNAPPRMTVPERLSDARLDEIARDLERVLNSDQGPGLGEIVIQNRALIRIDGREALAFLGSTEMPGYDGTITIRLILFRHGKHALLFEFAARNDEFPGKVVGFEKFMASVHLFPPALP